MARDFQQQAKDALTVHKVAVALMQADNEACGLSQTSASDVVFSRLPPQDQHSYLRAAAVAFRMLRPHERERALWNAIDDLAREAEPGQRWGTCCGATRRRAFHTGRTAIDAWIATMTGVRDGDARCHAEYIRTDERGRDMTRAAEVA